MVTVNVEKKNVIFFLSPQLRQVRATDGFIISNVAFLRVIWFVYVFEQVTTISGEQVFNTSDYFESSDCYMVVLYKACTERSARNEGPCTRLGQ